MESVITLQDDQVEDLQEFRDVNLGRPSSILQPTDSEVVLQSQFTINDVPYSVRLSRSELTCSPIGLDQADPSYQPARLSRSSRCSRGRQSSTELGDSPAHTETVYYQPPDPFDGGRRYTNAPVLLVPTRSLSAVDSALTTDDESSLEEGCSCAKKKDLVKVRSLHHFCDISKQSLKLKELVAVVTASGRRLDSRDYRVGGAAFIVYSVHRVSRHRWRYSKLVLHHKDSSVITLWIEQINALLTLPELARPKSLLVFVNPISGSGHAVKVYRRNVAPLFELAGVTTEVIYTERQNHARDILLSYDLNKFDGIVSVGGDGMFSEVVHGLIIKTLRQSGVDQPTTDIPLPQPQWRIGIIPAGSTDTVSYCIHGSNDPITSALHIVVGDGLAMDVGTVFHNKQFIKFNLSLLGYGYYGDCIVDSERNRWMGPKRYDWEGFKKVLANRSYEGEISFLPSKTKQYHPRDGIPCVARCHVCQAPPHPTSGSASAGVGVAGDRRVSGDLDEGWQKVKGRFVAINSFLISCRCRYALQGPAPCAHLGDGCSDLVLVHKCSRFEYLQHLIRCTDPNKDQFDFPFIQTFRVTQFKFRPFVDDGEDPPLPDPMDSSTTRIDAGGGGSAQRLRGSGAGKISAWNCDGEPVTQPTVECRIHRQVIRLFARGVEEGNLTTTDSTSGCCECC